MTRTEELEQENAALKSKLEIATEALKIADRYWFGDAEKGVVCATCDFGSIGEDHGKDCPIGAAHKALSKISPLPHPLEVM